MDKNLYQWSKTTWIIFLTLFVLAGTTRFYRLDWSFWGDETTTFKQVEILTGTPFFASQFDGSVLGAGTRSNPLGYSLQWLVYHFWGKGEAEARLGVAIAGTLVIPLAFLLASRLYGQVTGVILAGMLLLSPWHVFHSQNQRNYSYVFLFASLALLSAALAWKDNNRRWAILSGMTTILAVLTHSLSIMIPMFLGAFVLGEVIRRQSPFPWRAIKSYLLVVLPLLTLICLWAFIGWRSWSGEQTWGYSSLHTLMGLTFNLNWGIALMACAGCLWTLWNSQDSVDRMWAIGAFVLAALSTVLPFFLAFRPDYVFSGTLVFYMLATRALTQLYERLKVQWLPFAISIIMAFLLAPLPAFLSHYQDGDRPDYRTAAGFIEKRYLQGDIVAADSAELLEHYLPELEVEAVHDINKGAATVERLELLRPENKQRLWLVFRLSRQEPPVELDQWLWKNAVRMLRIKKRRFDYHENITDVYLID